jgi:cellulose synthase/poly-beta-1,6-N-acetylglucosamine synthase-like glycosyltransferase
LKELECDDFTLNIYYVIDTFPGDKRTLHWELPDNFIIILRDTNRGYRAGAINDALSVMKNPDYVAIFDVEHRPAKDYLIKCVSALEKNDAAVSSSGCRFATNKNNVLTKMIAVEYDFFCNLYRFFSRSDSFMSFGGAGVVRGSFLEDEKFNEEATLDDIDLTARAYIKEKVAILADTTMGEQAPTTLRDLYYQRVRWYRGAVETLSKYLAPMVKAPIPFSRKISWFAAHTIQFFPFLLTPVVIAYLGKIKKVSTSALEFVKIFLGGVGYLWFLTACGIVAIVKHLTSSKFEWKPSTRADA